MHRLLGEAPYADRVGASPELPANVPDLREPYVLGQDVTDLVHGGAPAEPAVEVIEYLDGVRGVVLLEVDPHLLSESSCPRHQATTEGVAWLARSLSCRPCQLEGLTLTCAAGLGRGPHELWSEITPVELTSAGSFDPCTDAFVLRRVARETTLHGSGRFL